MKDKHDKATADMFEMSDTDILRWMGKYVSEIRRDSEGYTACYSLDGVTMKFSKSVDLKEAVRKAAQCIN